MSAQADALDRLHVALVKGGKHLDPAELAKHEAAQPEDAPHFTRKQHVEVLADDVITACAGIVDRTAIELKAGCQKVVNAYPPSDFPPARRRVTLQVSNVHELFAAAVAAGIWKPPATETAA